MQLPSWVFFFSDVCCAVVVALPGLLWEDPAVSSWSNSKSPASLDLAFCSVDAIRI